LITRHPGTWRPRNGSDAAQRSGVAPKRVIKPDPAIDRILFKRYDLAPDDCIFIDGSANNVETARALGMQGIHFVEPIDVRVALAACRLAV